MFALFMLFVIIIHVLFRGICHISCSIKMIAYLLVSLLSSQSTATIIRTTSEGLFIPINYITDVSDEPHAGLARLDLFCWPEFETDDTGLYSPTFDTAIGINFGYDESFLRFEAPRPYRYRLDSMDGPDALATPLLRIGAQPNSLFVRRFPSFVISSPVDQDHFEIILDSDDPSQYALGGQFFYSPIVPRSLLSEQYQLPRWMINVAIYLENNHQPEFTPCDVKLGDPAIPIRVPRHVMAELLEIIASRGIEIETRRVPLVPYHIWLRNIDEATVDTLPTLKYLVQGEDGEAIQIGELAPREYIHHDSRTQSDWKVLLTDWGNLCVLNRQSVKGLALHFDFAHNRLGFADSL